MVTNTTVNGTTTIKIEPASLHIAHITAIKSGGSADISRTVSTMKQSESITVLVTTRPQKIDESTT